MDGVTATKALADAGIDVRVVMLSIYDNVAVKQAAADAGVCAFVCKQDPSECLLAAIRAAVEDAGRS
jgi:DNA-binding NarL/FixJ family response regulator